ncbi:hypothetical protein Nepgr_002913 [Nepenthes gracilis]|uniref:Uncharacterized protein n=1 Tax=Nepenthes gracilis TaxID=150966 RepID=A0AAD3PA66_NEPGR|nr:hypothetical protein Nepgr_002913 [Nepenthes gracilis]
MAVAFAWSKRVFVEPSASGQVGSDSTYILKPVPFPTVVVWVWSQCLQCGLACCIVSRYCKKPKSALPLADQSADLGCLLMPTDPTGQLVQKRLVAMSSGWTLVNLPPAKNLQCSKLPAELWVLLLGLH